MQGMGKRSLIIVGLALLIAGCGGGGGTIAGGGAGGQDVNIGSIQARAQSGNPTPLLLSNGNTNFFSLYGATFSRVTYTPARVLANTRIAFGSGGGNMWTCDASGGHMRQVTFNYDRGGATFPTWSPDAFRIAFIANHAGYGLHVTGATGYGERGFATPNLVSLGRPSWSATNLIAFTATDNTTGRWQIFTVPANGGSASELPGPATDDLYDPTWTPDGTKIAFIRLSDHNIWMMNASGTGLTALTSGGTFDEPQFSPDGTQLVAGWFDGTHKQIARIKDGVNSVLTVNEGFDHESPSWSPDGKMIAYGVPDGVGGIALWTMAEDGSNKTQILGGPNQVYSEPTWSPFPVARTMVGTSGLFGTASQAGFLFSQDGNNMTSFLSFNAPTPGTTLVENAGSTSGFQTFKISGGGGINSLRYGNDLLLAPITVIPGSGFSSVTGILVTMNTNDGSISLVVPYSKMNTPLHTKTGTIYTGQFLAEYDGRGKNLAPNGATRIVL